MSENKKHYAKKSEKKRGNLIFRKPKKRLPQTKNKNLPVEQVLHLQRTIGNKAVNRLIQSGTIQPKLTIGKPDSIYEKEADRVADRVMSMPERSLAQRESTCPECPERKEIQSKPLTEQITPLVQRQPEEEEAQTKLLAQRQNEEEEEAQAKPLAQRQAEEEEEPQAKPLAQRQVEEEEEAQAKPLVQRQNEEEEEKSVQSKAAPQQGVKATPSIESSIDAMKGGGQPLPESTRDFYEPRFGADFSHVRVHTDSRAAQTAQAINAKAFTTGKNIVFNAGQYSPGTSAGKSLLAHELTHVLQQGGGIKSDTLHKQQQNQGNQPQNVLTVVSVAQQNITDANGNVIGMSGTQTVTYTYSDGRQVTETHNVEWREDANVEPGQATQYEHPARAENFNIQLGGAGQTYRIQTSHSEGGIAIHGPGRSEGCIITGNAIRTDIENRLNASEALRGEISNVTDARPADQQRAAPMPQ